MATIGIGMETEAATTGTWAEIEGVVALLLRNEGTGTLALLVVPLTEPREK